MTEEKAPSNIQPAHINAIIVLLMLLILITGFQIWKDNQPGPKWEYMIESVPDASFTQRMNVLGAEGWEMMSARRATANVDSLKPDYHYEMIFRRKAR